MKVFLKIIGLVFLYFTVVVTGLLVSFPELSEAILKGGSGEIFGYELDKTLPFGIPEKDISVLIVPHHLVADKQIRDGFAHTAAARRNLKTRRIILMGPNHFFRGKAKVITAAQTWRTNYGELAPDSDFIQHVTQQNLAALENGILPRDHSITALLPFIERFFPDAKFVPLLVREPMKRSDTKLLADFFHQNLTPEDLIIASIDFSHYFPKEVADAHDRESLTALQTLDIDFFEHKIDADARQILMVLGDYLKQRGHTKFTLSAHTNSAILMSNPHETSTTSHFVGYYSQ
jgi:AmmeMemoRadiSam system protein B